MKSRNIRFVLLLLILCFCPFLPVFFLCQSHLRQRYSSIMHSHRLEPVVKMTALNICMYEFIQASMSSRQMTTLGIIQVAACLWAVKDSPFFFIFVVAFLFSLFLVLIAVLISMVRYQQWCIFVCNQLFIQWNRYIHTKYKAPSPQC